MLAAAPLALREDENRSDGGASGAWFSASERGRHPRGSVLPSLLSCMSRRLRHEGTVAREAQAQRGPDRAQRPGLLASRRSRGLLPAPARLRPGPRRCGGEAAGKPSDLRTLDRQPTRTCEATPRSKAGRYGVDGEDRAINPPSQGPGAERPARQGSPALSSPSSPAAATPSRSTTRTTSTTGVGGSELACGSAGSALTRSGSAPRCRRPLASSPLDNERSVRST